MTQRDCDDCRYGKLEGTEEPCKSCKATDEGFTNWRNREHPAMTNADRIRAMSDEELAAFLSEFKDCGGGCLVGKGIKDCSGLCATANTLKIWLQQTAEEDDHDERKESENV